MAREPSNRRSSARRARSASALLGKKFELRLASGHERHLRHDGYRSEPCHREGKPTTPITYDSNCLEEICGSCAMRINGKARMACSALVDKSRPAHHARAAFASSLSSAICRRSLRAVRESEARQGLGSGGRHLRPRLRAARFPAAAGRGISAFELHLLHMLHGSLPAIQREHRLRRRSDHLPGQAFQQSPHRKEFSRKSVCTH